MNRKEAVICVVFGVVVLSCGFKKEQERAAMPEKSEVSMQAQSDADAASAKRNRVLLVAQSVFTQDEQGRYTVPQPAEMILLTPAPGAWTQEKVVDADSNVFHKAMPYGQDGILTIGATEAQLKLWTKKDGKWEAETIWNPTFGGRHNRLRDMELADFDGDGVDEIVIATHDQGVIAVVWNRGGGKWEVQEIDRKPDTFVHEIEIGDLDGDGKLEIYTTPSDPNTSSGVDQGGGIMRYAWTQKGFKKSEVVHYDKRHIKEILVADVDGDGRHELYASVEAQMGEGYRIEVPVDIVRFDYRDGKFVPTPVAQLAGERFCRFLVAGDVTNDGKTDLVAAAFSTGVWLIQYTEGEYRKTLIDEKSGGFEHAAYLADMTGDGQLELYVADDNGGELKQHVFRNGRFETTVIAKRLVPRQAMVWNITFADL